MVLAGKGAGTLHPGRHVSYPAETPMTNLYLSLLDRIGVLSGITRGRNGAPGAVERNLTLMPHLLARCAPIKVTGGLC